MSQKTRRLRYSVLIAMAIALVAGLFAATPASAIGPATTGPPAPVAAGGNQVFLAAPNGETEVYRGINGNEAGNLALAATDDVSTLAPGGTPSIIPMTVVNGERIIIEVSDAKGINCNPNTSEYIGFSEVPTVLPIGGNASFDVQLASSTPNNNLRNAATGCTAPFTPTVKDQLVLTVTDAPNAGGSLLAILVTGVKYDVGSQAGVGEARIRWNDDVPPTDPTIRPAGADTTAPCAANADRGANTSATWGGPAEFGTCTPFLASNAYITNLIVDTSAANAIQPGAGRSIGDITFTETNFDSTTPEADLQEVTPIGNDPAVNGVCIELTGNQRVRFTGAGTVATSTGGDTPQAPVIISDTLLRFGVTSSNPATKSTFVLSGVQVNTTDFGQQTLRVYQCDKNGIGHSIVYDGTPGPIQPVDPGYNNDANHNGNTTDGEPAGMDEVVTYTQVRRLLVTVVGSTRYAGINRNDTARIIGDRLAGCSDFVIVARNDDFADALAASYVSGQMYYSPILLVNTHGPVPPETLDGIRRLGATDVFIMGGVNAVGPEVEQQLDGLTSFQCGGGAARRTPEDQIRTINTQRIAGDTRFGTARQAGLFNPGGIEVGRLNLTGDPGLPPLRTMILANGRNFPDAMVAGPMAAQGSTCAISGGSGADCNGFPLLETDGNSSTLPPDTDAFITERNIEQVLIVGGTGAVPQSLEDSLTARGLNVVRLAGDTRQLTAIEVAKFEYKRLQFGVNRDCSVFPEGDVALARGDFFTDALALGPLAGAFDFGCGNQVAIPILLTQDSNTVGADTDAFLATIAGDWFDPTTGGSNIANDLNEPPDTFGFSVFFLNIAGGTAAISNAAQQEALNSLVGT